VILSLFMNEKPSRVTKEILPNGDRLYTMSKKVFREVVEKARTNNENIIREQETRKKERLRRTQM